MGGGFGGLFIAELAAELAVFVPVKPERPAWLCVFRCTVFSWFSVQHASGRRLRCFSLRPAAPAATEPQGARRAPDFSLYSLRLRAARLLPSYQFI